MIPLFGEVAPHLKNEVEVFCCEPKNCGRGIYIQDLLHWCLRYVLSLLFMPEITLVDF
jgi:hypothetical protein